jgi:hypothetical protein
MLSRIAASLFAAQLRRHRLLQICVELVEKLVSRQPPVIGAD